MCNPPFFKEFGAEHTDDNERQPSPANTGQPFERAFSGGEFEFVKQMMTESAVVGDKVAIFTSMLGRKASLKELRKFINESGVGVTSQVTAEFCQGKVMRWGIAWTFRTDIDLTKSHRLKHFTPKAPLRYQLPFTMKNCEYALPAVTERVKQLLADDLHICFDVIRETVHTTEIWITSDVNTWSGQRRKRRQQMREAAAMHNVDLEHSGDSGDATAKRKLDSSTEESFEELSVQSPQKKVKEGASAESEQAEADSFLLHCSLVLKQKNKAIVMKVQTKDMCRDHEAPHQVFQYFKNKLV